MVQYKTVSPRKLDPLVIKRSPSSSEPFIGLYLARWRVLNLLQSVERSISTIITSIKQLIKHKFLVL